MRYYFIFCKTDLVLQKLGDGTYTIPKSEDSPIMLHDWQHVHNITPMDDGTEVKTVMLDDPAQLNERVASFKDAVFEFCPLRKSYYKLSRDLYLKAGKCQEILYWDHISKRCPNCGKEVWPELATAIIVLIHKGNEVLLVHARNFKGDFYGLVAGFVETGETLEEAVHREVMEETGLTITNLKYFGSQPWPYPCGLMVGYNADYVSGDIHLQRSELSKGDWFTRDNLPTIPEKLSIARKLLDNWLDETATNKEEEK